MTRKNSFDESKFASRTSNSFWRSFGKALMCGVLLSLFLVSGFTAIMGANLGFFPQLRYSSATSSIPSSVRAFVNITITNNQSISTSVGMQQFVSVNMSKYIAYLNH
jgi:hypothetical protein